MAGEIPGHIDGAMLLARPLVTLEFVERAYFRREIGM